ncbi:uncharacterized protein LOC134240080 [Saccostrea cucullata]|uniref:uncharacterized protein LOC134240080 n=1 Tax=Saccostrea cuccullata TaxID=36930 RepID=UPI002ED53886
MDKQKVIVSHKIKVKQTRSMQVMAWLHSYADNYGEKIPNTSQIHLPPCSMKQQVYKTMVEETGGDVDQPVSHFLRLWRDEAPHIAIPKLQLCMNPEHRPKEKKNRQKRGHRNLISSALPSATLLRKTPTQNSLCVRIKEIDCAIQFLLGVMQEEQKKYNKYADQFQRISETISILNRVKNSMQKLVPKMECLNQMLPPKDQLEPLSLKSQLLEPDVTT